MPTGTYKLQSVARPGRYISLADGKVVGNSAESGAVIEWYAAFDEENLASFQAVSNGQLFDEYISFDSETGSLTTSKTPYLFAVTPSPRQPSFFAMEVVAIKKVWALTSWDQGAPIELQDNTDATQQLWLFDAPGSAE